MSYSTLVISSIKDGLAAQLSAPFTGSAIAGAMRDQGKHVIIIYDDLGRHGNSYMEHAELINEAKSASYLHAQLLERAAQLSPEKGGGSLTALCLFSCEDAANELLESGRSNLRLLSSLIGMVDNKLILNAFHAAQRFYPPLKVSENLPLHPQRFQPRITCVAGQHLSNLLTHSRHNRRDKTIAERLGFEIEDSDLPLIEFEAKLEKFMRQPQGSHLSLPEQLIILFAASQPNYLSHVASSDLALYEEGLISWIRNSTPELWDNLDQLKFDDALSSDISIQLQRQIQLFNQNAFD